MKETKGLEHDISALKKEIETIGKENEQLQTTNERVQSQFREEMKNLLRNEGKDLTQIKTYDCKNFAAPATSKRNRGKRSRSI